jgi:mannose-6-phosphate isomerase-like protein (cupin superfamily)
MLPDVGGGRVSERAQVTASPANGDVARHPSIPPEPGSPLSLETIALAPSSSLELNDDGVDSLLFVYEGTGSVELAGEEHRFASACSTLVPAGSTATIHSGETGLTCVRITVADEVDLHAPFGSARCVVALEEAESGTATGARSFQILHGPHNGSVRATAFAGTIPPGKAPWHYHLYDEIVWIREGRGRLHLGETVEELAPGCAFRLHPREVHIVENLSEDEPLEVVGFFTPAGSPSAAYLEPGVAESYALS